MKQYILLEIERRFCDIERFQILAVSTILDPRFKKMHFQQPIAASTAISYINSLIQRSTNENQNCTATIPVECNETNNSLWNVHDNLVSCTNIRNEPDSSGINIELKQYLTQPVISRHNDPLKYWQTLKYGYPTLFNIAIKYLAIVGTSVSSERMFSKAGIIKSESRNRLIPARLNKLLFLGSLTREEWGFI